MIEVIATKEELIKMGYYQVIEDKDKEIERLNNIINKLEKRCNEMLKLYNTFNDEQKFNNWKEYKVYGTILDWIEELKGEDKK